MRSSDDSERSEAFLFCQQLRSSHVNELQIAIVLNHNVLRLQIPIDDVLHVQILHAQDQRRYIESSNRFGEDTYFSYNIKQLRTFNILQKKVDVLRVFKALHESQHQGEINSLQNVFLLKDYFLHFVLNHLLLFYALQSIEFTTSFRLFYKVNLPELSLTKFLHMD